MLSLFKIEWFVNWSCVAGGESTAENCQILQTRVNRYKSDKDNVDQTQLKGFSCDVKFTGTFAHCSTLFSASSLIYN